MSDHLHPQKVPLAALVGAAVLILATVGLAATARSSRLSEPVVAAPARESYDLRFEDRADGSIAVLDASGPTGPTDSLDPSNLANREVSVVPPASNGFLRGVLRGMFRSRKLESISRDEKFILARQADGRLTLEDPKDGRKVDLDSFGPTNSLAFSSILDAARAARSARSVAVQPGARPQ